MANNDKENSKPDNSQIEGKYISGDVAIGSAIGVNATVFASVITDKRSLRDWWHNILREYGRYPCSAIFLFLPSDKEARTYFVDFGKEIDLLSGDNCLVIALSENDFKSVGFDNNIWLKVAEAHSNEGHSIKVARLFDIDFTQFPCVVFFDDIRSSDYSIITFKGLTAQEISNKMRSIFSVIQDAVESKQAPLATIKSRKNLEFIKSSGKITAARAGNFVEKSFETAMQAWIKAIIA
jgi:hypothetical protein